MLADVTNRFPHVMAMGWSLVLILTLLLSMPYQYLILPLKPFQVKFRGVYSVVKSGSRLITNYWNPVRVVIVSNSVIVFLYFSPNIDAVLVYNQNENKKIQLITNFQADICTFFCYVKQQLRCRNGHN